MKTVLITGGLGFLGTNIAEKFLREGWGVLTFDNMKRRGVESNIIEHENYTFRHGDVRNKSDLKKIPDIHAIINLAANPGIPWSIKNPVYDFEVNAMGALNMLEIARQRKIPFVQASTNKVYSDYICELELTESEKRYDFVDMKYANGIKTDFPMDSFGKHPHSPYGVSKCCADLYAQEYYHIYNVPTTVFRMSCIYGKHQIGVEDQGWVAWFMIAKILGKPLNIFGDGKQVRDLLYGSDIANLYYQAVTDNDNFAGKVFNVGGGKHNSVSLIETIEKIYQMDKDLGYDQTPFNMTFKPWRQADHKVYISDIGPLNGIWEPKFGVDEGLKETYIWLNENKDKLKGFYDN